jgi:hypothetical protein
MDSVNLFQLIDKFVELFIVADFNSDSSLKEAFIPGNVQLMYIDT